MMYRSKATQKLNNIAYALIIGGALGNLFDACGTLRCRYDRLLRRDWHFATFNLADTAICVGAALIVLEVFYLLKRKNNNKPCRCAYRLLRNRRPHPAKILKNKKQTCMSESVQSNSAVLVHFTLKLDDGTTAESTRNNGKPALFRLGDASLSEGLEQHLLGLKVGDKTTFTLEPDAAFGVPSPDLIQYFSRREFMDAGEPEIGAIMLFTAMDGSEMPGVIREINGDSITVDFNHPLAGQTVHFDIEVLEIDPALEA